ncbi:MAG: hypothetical protein WKF84_02465 [Pyrinomonadaceae bacterium]
MSSGESNTPAARRRRKLLSGAATRHYAAVALAGAALLLLLVLFFFTARARLIASSLIKLSTRWPPTVLERKSAAFARESRRAKSSCETLISTTRKTGELLGRAERVAGTRQN